MSPRVIGLLNWYEENPSWLAECVSSAARLCDHIIAVDGPYGMFPGSTAKPSSSPSQADTIHRVCNGSGIGSTIHTPGKPWWGGEVEKRDFMFQLGMQVATPWNDWFLRIDADEALTDVPADTKTLLYHAKEDVAEVMIWERSTELGDSSSAFRCLYRAIPGIRVQQAHYVITVPPRELDRVKDPTRVRVLSGDDQVHQLEPALQLLDVKLEHKTRMRLPERQGLKKRYQDAMERSEIEKTKPFR